MFCLSLLNKFLTLCTQIKINSSYFMETYNCCNLNSANYIKRVIFRIKFTWVKNSFTLALLVTLVTNSTSVWMTSTKWVNSYQVIFNGRGWDRKWMIRSAASPATKSPSGWISSSFDGMGGAWGITSYSRVTFPLLSCVHPPWFINTYL